MSYPDRKYVMRLIRNVNRSKRRVQKDMYPLKYTDNGWRFVFPKSLEFYDFLPSGRKLLELSSYGIDFQGGYYVIQYRPRP